MGPSRNDAVEKSCETRAGGDVRALRPFARADLAGVGLHARHFEASVGADHRDAVSIHSDDLAELAGDPLRALGWHRLCVENLDGLAIEGGPGGRRRVAAADQPVDLLPRFAPVDLGIAGAAAAFVGGLRLVLL